MAITIAVKLLNGNKKERSEGIDVDEGVFNHLFLLNAMVVSGGAASMSKTHWPRW
jgi:hypothetical protein